MRAVLLLPFLSIALWLLRPRPTPEPAIIAAPKIKGFSWEATDSVGLSHIQTITPYHVEWIAQTPFAWQGDPHQPELVFHNDRGYWGERDRGLIHTTQLARTVNLQTMLKPHIWMHSNSGAWRSDIAMRSEADWQTWFTNYEAFILHYARLAEAEGIPMLCIGTELFETARQRAADWRRLIAKIREVYSGQLTYAANFYQEYEAIQFWDALDYIGIQGYFPLAKTENPGLAQLKRGWQPHYRALKEFSRQWERPVIFTELGYRSMRNAAIEPWAWPDNMDFDHRDISPEVQARCYEAFFQTFWEEDWVAGVFFWKWSRRNYNAATKRRRRDHSAIDFSPKAEALGIVSHWFAQEE